MMLYSDYNEKKVLQTGIQKKFATPVIPNLSVPAYPQAKN